MRSKEAEDIIKKFEGLKLFPYYDSAGKLTVGCGHLVKPGEDFSKGITEQEALDLLAKDLEHSEKAVDRLVTIPLSAGQFGALVSLCYNIGEGNFSKSTLLRKLNQGHIEEAAEEFLRWNRAGGREIKGLTNRREAEKKLFLGETA